MPALFGFILGVIVTIGGAYLYDSSTGRAANGLSPTAATHAPMVNWDVVGNNWRDFTTSVRNTTTDLETRLSKHSG
jgi:hypothetical protein